MIVQLNGVSKSFGSQDVLRDVSFQINPSEKIGLIGANGAGKTTLLKILSGIYEPDSGALTRKSGLGRSEHWTRYPIFTKALPSSKKDSALRIIYAVWKMRCAGWSIPSLLSRTVPFWIAILTSSMSSS